MTGRFQGRARRCPARPCALASLQRPAEPATAHVQPAQQAREAAVSVAVAASARAHAVQLQQHGQGALPHLLYPAACTAAQIAVANAGPYTVIASGSPGEIRPGYCRETFSPPKKVQKKMMTGPAARMPRLCGGPFTNHPTDLEHLCTHHFRLFSQITIVLGRDPGPTPGRSRTLARCFSCDSAT